MLTPSKTNPDTYDTQDHGQRSNRSICIVPNIPLQHCDSVNDENAPREDTQINSCSACSEQSEGDRDSQKGQHPSNKVSPAVLVLMSLLVFLAGLLVGNLLEKF